MAISWPTFVAGTIFGISLHVWASKPDNIEKAKAEGEELAERTSEVAKDKGRRARRRASDAEKQIRQTTELRLQQLQERSDKIKEQLLKEASEQLEQAREVEEEFADEIEERGLKQLKPGTLYDPETDTVIQLPKSLTKKTISDLRGIEAPTSSIAFSQGE